MAYAPPEDIFRRVWRTNCSRGHVFYVYRPQNCGKIVISDFVLFKKKTTNPIFSHLHSLAVVEVWKYGVCCFSGYSSSWTCGLSQFFRYFSPRSSVLIIGIHRIMTHTDQIPQLCGGTYIVCVCLVSRYQMDRFYPFGVSPNIFYAGGRYKLLNQWKMSFSGSKPSWVSSWKKNNEKLVVFDVFIDTWCPIEISKFGYFQNVCFLKFSKSLAGVPLRSGMY